MFKLRIDIRGCFGNGIFVMIDKGIIEVYYIQLNVLG